MKMFLLFSHKLTDTQIKDAIQNLKVTDFIYLPDNLQKLWSNVPSDLFDLDEYIEVFKDFLITYPVFRTGSPSFRVDSIIDKFLNIIHLKWI